MRVHKRKYEFAWAKNYAIFELDRLDSKVGFILCIKRKFLWWSWWKDFGMHPLDTLEEAMGLLKKLVLLNSPPTNTAIVKGSNNITIIQK